MKTTFFLIIAFTLTMSAFAQEKNHSYDAEQSLEVESLVPMFLTGGYHIGVSYRYKQFRVRTSIINGGNYNAETAGINNSAKGFKRHYKTSPGIFLGYNIWRNLEIYSFLEAHHFEIEQKSTGLKKNMHSLDFGGGVGYQFFIGNYFYIQPAIHVYLRKSKSLDFDDIKYTIPTTDISPVFRIGYRFWSKTK